MVTTFLFVVFFLLDAAKTAIRGWCWSLNDRCTNNGFRVFVIEGCSGLRNLGRLNLGSRRHLGGVHGWRVQIGRHRRHVQIGLHKIVDSIFWLGRLRLLLVHWLLRLLSVSWLLIGNLSVWLLLHLWLDLSLRNQWSLMLHRDGIVNSHHVSGQVVCLS